MPVDTIPPHRWMPVTGERSTVENNSIQRCRKAFKGPYGWILYEVADLSALTLAQSNSRTINDESGHEDLWHIYTVNTVWSYFAFMLLLTHCLKNEKDSSQKPGCSVETHLQVLEKIQRWYRTSYFPLVWSARWHTFMNFPITQYSLVKQVALAAKLWSSIFHFPTWHLFNCCFFLYLLTS